MAMHNNGTFNGTLNEESEQSVRRLRVPKFIKKIGAAAGISTAVLLSACANEAPSNQYEVAGEKDPGNGGSGTADSEDNVISEFPASEVATETGESTDIAEENQEQAKENEVSAIEPELLIAMAPGEHAESAEWAIAVQFAREWFVANNMRSGGIVFTNHSVEHDEKTFSIGGSTPDGRKNRVIIRVASNGTIDVAFEDIQSE